MTLSPAPAPPAPKLPRLSRCASAPPAAASPPSPQITLSLNQLAGLGKVFTVAGNPLGGFSVLSPSDPSNLTLLSAAAGGPEGGAGPMTFLKVVGPQYQLVTLPPPALGGALQGLGVAQGAAPRSLGSGVALHTPLKAPADSEVCGVGDLQKVAVETESEGDQEC